MSLQKLLKNLSDSLDEALDEVIDSKIQQHLEKGILEMRSEKDWTSDSINNAKTSAIAAALDICNEASRQASASNELFRTSYLQDINKINQTIINNFKLILNAINCLIIIIVTTQMHVSLLTLNPLPSQQTIIKIINTTVNEINKSKNTINSNLNNINTAKKQTINSFINTLANSAYASFSALIRASNYSNNITNDISTTIKNSILTLFSSRGNNLDISFAVSTAVKNSLNTSNPKPDSSIIDKAATAAISAINNSTNVMTAITDELNKATPTISNSIISSTVNIAYLCNYVASAANASYNVTKNIIDSKQLTQQSVNIFYNNNKEAYKFISDITKIAIDNSKNNITTSDSNIDKHKSSVDNSVTIVNTSKTNVNNIINLNKNAIQINYNNIINKATYSSSINSTLDKLYFDMPFSITLIKELQSEILISLTKNISNPNIEQNNQITTIVNNIESMFLNKFSYIYYNAILSGMTSINNNYEFNDFYLIYISLNTQIGTIIQNKGKINIETTLKPYMDNIIAYFKTIYNTSINTATISKAFSTKFITTQDLINFLTTEITQSIKDLNLLPSYNDDSITDIVARALNLGLKNAIQSVINDTAKTAELLNKQATDAYKIFSSAPKAVESAYRAVESASTTIKTASTTIQTASNTIQTVLKVYDAAKAESDAAKAESDAAKAKSDATKAETDATKAETDLNVNVETLTKNIKYKNMLLQNMPKNLSTNLSTLSDIQKTKNDIDTILQISYILYFYYTEDTDKMNTIISLLKKINISIVYYYDLYSSLNKTDGKHSTIVNSLNKSLDALITEINKLPEII